MKKDGFTGLTDTENESDDVLERLTRRITYGRSLKRCRVYFIRTDSNPD